MESQDPPDPPPVPTPPPPPPPLLRSSPGWSRPLHADHAELAAAEAAVAQAARARRRPGRPPAPRCVGRFADGVEVHLASFYLADAELRLAGADDAVSAELKVRYADVLGGAPPGRPGMPPDRVGERRLKCSAMKLTKSIPPQ